MIVRYGRPAALLVPLEQPIPRARRVKIEGFEPDPQGPDEETELDDDERLLLVAAAGCAPDSYDPDDWPRDIDTFMRTRMRLELAGLMERDGAGRYRLTSKEEVVASTLRPEG